MKKKVMMIMITSCKASSTILALILIEILLCSSLCLSHDDHEMMIKMDQRDNNIGDTQRGLLPIINISSRKLLVSRPISSSNMASTSVSTSTSNKKLSTSNQLSLAEEEAKKAVEASLRKAPKSGPNPTQNK